MKARHEWIGQDQMIARVRTDARDVAVVQYDTLGRNAVLPFDRELEPRNGDGLAAHRDFHGSSRRDHRKRGRLTPDESLRRDREGRSAPRHPRTRFYQLSAMMPATCSLEASDRAERARLFKLANDLTR